MESRAHARIAPNSRRISRPARAVTPPRSTQIHRADFEKPSLRTRVTFDVGIQSMVLRGFPRPHASVRISRRSESIADVARTSSAGCRASSRAFTISVSSRNGGEHRHPRGATRFRQVSSLPGACRFLYTGRKIRALRGFKLAYVGDGNNVCHSLIYLAARWAFTCARDARGIHAPA